MIPFLLTLLGIWLFFRLFGKQILAWLILRVAKKFGAPGTGTQQQQSRPEGTQTTQAKRQTKQIVPDDVGEYVEYTEEKL